MCDARPNVRLDALNKILKVREKEGEENQMIKSTKLPKINFNANDYFELVDWTKTPFISPPVLQNISDEELTQKLNHETVYLDWEFCKLPCHTVAVERTVKLVTEASDRVYGSENREGYIRANLQSRSEMKKFDSKRDFTVQSNQV